MRKRENEEENKEKKKEIKKISKFSKRIYKKKQKKSSDNHNGGDVQEKTGHWRPRKDRLSSQLLFLYPNDWSKISSLIGTRTPSQVRSHNQRMHSPGAMKKKRDKLEIISNYLREKLVGNNLQNDSGNASPKPFDDEQKEVTLSENLIKILQNLYGNLQ